MRSKRLISILLLLAAFIVLIAGCSKAAVTSDSNGPALPKVVNIGTQQIPNGERIAIEKKLFEKALGVEVNIIEFQAGDIRNALVSKDIDFAHLGSSSATVGIANGLDVELIWIHEVLGLAEQLVARNGSGIETIQDLLGKKVATPFSSTAHYSLLKALELNGIAEKDVEIYDMQMPDLYAAWQRGDIDAAYAWEPTLSDLLADGKTIISSEDLANKGVVTMNVELVRREFAQQYPDLVVKYIKTVDECVALFKENQPEAVKSIATAMELTEVEALKQMTGSIWLRAEEQLDPAYFGTSENPGNLAAAIKDTADFLYDQNSLVSEPDLSVIEAAVNPFYIEQAVKEIKK